MQDVQTRDDRQPNGRWMEERTEPEIRQALLELCTAYPVGPRPYPVAASLGCPIVGRFHAIEGHKNAKCPASNGHKDHPLEQWPPARRT